jgi:hypothetical protein
MKRVVLLLPLALSPVYAIGFWGSFGSGLSFGGLREWKWKLVYSEGNYSWTFNDTLWATPGGLIPKYNFAVGLSLEPQLPLFLGIGLEYQEGMALYTFTDREYSSENREVISKFSWFVYTKRKNITFPLGFNFNFQPIKFQVGVYPAITNYTIVFWCSYIYYEYYYCWIEDGNGFTFGGFANAYYFAGPMGFGGGFYLDFGGASMKKDIEPRTRIESNLTNIIHYGINLNVILQYNLPTF